MNEIVKDKIALVFDDGLYLSLAVRLSRDFKHVYYFSEWRGEYPKSKNDWIGRGIPKVERVESWEAYIDEVDVFIFPSIYFGETQLLLESLGKRVWGSRLGDEFELQRYKSNKFFKSKGLAQPEMKQIIGIDALRKALQKTDDKWIKTNLYRGDGETWHHSNYKTSEAYLDEIEYKLGAASKQLEWLIVDPIDGDDIVEYGYDGYCIDGNFPDKTIFGYEVKDVSYCCVVKEYKKFSPLITEFNDVIAPELEKHRYRNFFHTEGRCGKDKVSKITDITCRLGSPPGELYMEMLQNLSEIIWHGSDGKMIQPVFEGKYGIEIMLDSPWAENRWYNIDFPDSISRWVKLRNYCIIDDTYHVIPRFSDFDNIGALIAIGDSIEECLEKAKKYKEKIEAFKLDIPTSAIDKAQEVIKKGESIGLKFD